MPDPFRRDESARPGASTPTLAREVVSVKRRLIDEATAAVGMLEAALASLWELDTQSAGEILKRDDRIDREEVEI